MTEMQVSITQRGELPVSVSFDALYYDYTTNEKGKVMIQFDDGWASEYWKAYPMMKDKGFVGNIGIISDQVGKKNYVTIEQLREMYADGWDIYNHTVSHPRLTSLTDQQVERELSESRAFLMRHRFTRAVDFIAYPYGDFNDSVIDIAKQYSRFARSITTGFEVGTPINPYRLKTIELVNGVSPSVYEDAIRSVAENGHTVIFFLHRIEDEGTDSIILNTEDFQKFLDFLDAYRDEVDVISISEWYKTFEK